MPDIISKIIFWTKKPAIIVVVGQGRSTATEAILKLFEKESRRPLVITSGLESEGEVSRAIFFIKNSSFPILAATFAGEAGTAQISRLIENMPANGRIVFNFDDESLRQLPKRTKTQNLTFGFKEGADFRATDIFITESPAPGTNFKINYEGKIVPFWLTNLFGDEHIYAALAAAAVGSVRGLNLVAISQALMENRDAKPSV